MKRQFNKWTGTLMVGILGTAGMAACASVRASERPSVGVPSTLPTLPTLHALDAPRPDLSPTALAASPDGKTLFIACATANQVLVFDTARHRPDRAIGLPASPQGLALSRDGARLFIACAAPASWVVVWDVPGAKILDQISARHTAVAPVLSPDEQMLYLCNRFDHSVSFIDLAARQEIHRVAVAREPIAADLTPDGRFLLVANHLQAGRADEDVVTAVVSVIDTARGEVCKEIPLANGSGLLRDIRLSPDGNYACVAHVLAHFHYPAVTLDWAWINGNALSVIDLQTMALVNTVPLDDPEEGAANPWALAWGGLEHLLVAHAGTHELSLIKFPELVDKLTRLPAPNPTLRHPRFAQYHIRQVRRGARSSADVPHDLRFLEGLRERIVLADRDRGPRAVAVIGRKAWLANYFSDSLSVVDLDDPTAPAASIPLAAPREMSAARRGEFLFNDATLCYQYWQSCASCHDSDGRADALNWDLPNDGWNNPKNTKSLLLAHQTPPAMSLGVRKNAEAAVRAGLEKILFSRAPEPVAAALDAFLKSLKPTPSPFLVVRQLSASAQRGQGLFMDPSAGCAGCHTPPWFTNLKACEVGTLGKYDKPADRFDTPALLELWRTGPYLHDGSALTLREVLTTRNLEDRHGKTSHLSPNEIEDLVEYLNSL